MRQAFTAAIVLASLASILSIQSAAASDPTHLVISNMRDTSFVVSWLTADAQSGQVQLINGKLYDDDRGADFTGQMHYVTVIGLQAQGTYSFDVISGGKSFDHAGEPWSVDTGATLAPRSPDLIAGQVTDPNGSPAIEAMVFVMIDRVQEGVSSATLSTRVTPRDKGIFHLDLSEARAASDPNRYFAYTADSDRYMNNSITVLAIGPQGDGLSTLDAGDPRLRTTGTEPALDIQLVGTEQQTPASPTQQPTPQVSPTP